MKAERRAEVVWQGDLLKGSGTIVSTGSGALGDLPVSWAARTERSDGKTSPEELIAAAHASCYAMAFSHGLAQGGNPPERLEVRAVCTFEQVDPGWAVTRMELEVEGHVPGLDARGFVEAAEEAREGCPVSRALKGNVEITVRPTLAES